MKRYSIFHIPVLSFFSRALYRDVCLQWKGTGFAFLLLLLAVCWIPTIMRVHENISDYVDGDLSEIIAQIPKLSIVDGEASIEESQPYTIIDPETGKTLVLIDTTGTITSLADTDAEGLITKSGVEWKQNDIATRTTSFEQTTDLSLDQDMIRGWVITVMKFSAPVLYLSALLGSYVYRILQTLLYAAIGILIAYFCKSKRKYVELIRLTVVALTPCLIVQSLFGIAQITIPWADLWYFLAAMGYLLFGIKAASQEEDPDVQSSRFPVPS